MSRKQFLFFNFIFFLSLIFSSCFNSKNPTLIELINQMPSKKLENYDFNPEIPVISRINETPDFLLDYLKKLDNTDAYSSYLPTNEELDIIGLYLDLLPPLHKETIREKLIGIYFVNNWLGSGMADYVIDDDRNIYTVLIINPDTLKSGLSELMTNRENTCFLNDDDQLKISVNCGTEYLGFLYILLHETTHIVDYIHDITPYVEPNIVEIKNRDIKKVTSITEGIWREHKIPVDKYQKTYMKSISFYGFNNGPLLNISDAGNIYAGFMETPFPSLYGSKNWAEDFAEMLTWYHITEKLNQPYEIKLYENEEVIFSYEPMESEMISARIHNLGIMY